MWKFLVRLVYGKDCELRERMFRTMILAGGAATLIGCTEIFFVMEINDVLLPMLLLLVLVMGTILFITFKYRKYDLASILLGLIIIVMVFPAMFCLSGAIHSGAAVWLALGILYIFIMFSGKRMYFFLALCAISYGVTWWGTYTFPEIVVPMPTEAMAYVDSYFSVIVVGVLSGVILKTHMRVFEREHRANIRHREELAKASDSKNAFFANMSHEIRSPINTIIGLNEMIMRENPSEQIREYTRDIQIASKMLLSQVNDILDLSQMEINKMRIIPGNYRTIDMLGELVEMIRVPMEKKKLALYLDIDRSLPSGLCGDEKRIKQILLNILDNAVKYTEEGAVTLSVQGEAGEADEFTLVMKIADTGIGIRKEDMEHLYDSFNRVDERRNARIMGSGLGLAITKQLVDLMEGEITVDSIYTKGSVFTVIIKQKVVDSVPVGVVNLLHRGATESEVYVPSFEAPEARILIVDDNRMNAGVAGKLLAATKVQVDIVSSGAECLEMTKKKYYHVILLDYMMPGMNGEETLRSLHNQENGLCREAAVIALTANAMSGAREMYQEQGFDGYVEKPILGKELEREILKFLPSDILEYVETNNHDEEYYNQIQRISTKKRKKIYVTADCVCDIPRELLEKYDIRLMYVYIRTPQGRFADTREINSDSLKQYVSGDQSTAYADSATIEEYEEFFAETLTQAESVIFISSGGYVGRNNARAIEAAQGFDHVHIINSGQISCGQGLLTLHAARLAAEGKNVAEICEEIERVKTRVRTRFLIPGIEIFYNSGRISNWAAKVCRTFNWHLYVAVKPKGMKNLAFFGGSNEDAWKQAIRVHLHNKRKIRKEVVYITHVCCSVRQLELIKSEILKRVPFERVIIQQASFSSACSSGIETIGISYYSV